MTANYEALHATLIALEEAGLPAPKAQFGYHQVSEERATAIITSLPSHVWRVDSYGIGAWLRGVASIGNEVTVWLQNVPTTPDLEPPARARARALLARVQS